MKKKNKIILYSVILLLGVLIFTLEIFIFKKPDGLLGFIICLTSLYLILGSIIKLCKLSKKCADTFMTVLDLLFWLP